MHQKIELEAEQHAEHIHAAANPSNESAAETVGTARVLDALFHYQHGGRFRESGAGYQQAAAKSKGFLQRCSCHFTVQRAPLNFRNFLLSIF